MRNLTPPVTDGLLFALVPAGATLLDVSGHGRHPTVEGTPGNMEWVRRDGVWQLQAVGDGRLVIANDATLEAVTDFSVFCAGEMASGAAQLLYKGDAGGLQIDLYKDNGTEIEINDGSNTRVADIGQWAGVSSFCSTFESGGIGALYRNGVWEAAFDGITTITGDNADVTVLNYYTGVSPLLGNVRAFLFYSRAIDAHENAETALWSKYLASPFVFPDRRYFFTGSSVPNGDAGGVVGAWDLGRPTLGEAADSSGHGNHGELIGGVAPVFSEVGRALEFDGATGRVELASDVVGAGPVSVRFVARARSAGVTGRLIDNGKFLTYFRLANRITLSSNGGATKIDTPADSILYGQWYHIVVTRDAAGAGQIYISGELAQSGATGTPVGAAAVTFGNRAAGDRGWDGDIKDVVEHNHILTPAEIKSDYAKLARKVMFDASLDQYPPTEDLTSGEIGPFSIVTGTWALSEDSTGKRIECIAAGKLRVRLPSADKFHTDAFEETGSATLTKNSDNIEIDATNGDTSRVVRLTLGAPP